ncbi:hypothetical protein GLE_2316 [Lysobacter enzymogenes]|uniref:Uncharacterized protein n=1 Tax=Lysobacter enzymogenes TaxID=69 RepID=A0A0S2DGG1_LYSEN|nr:hypothetical protein GLE_2316 [Lysobacter enzymogenes]
MPCSGIFYTPAYGPMNRLQAPALRELASIPFCAQRIPYSPRSYT